MQLPTNEASLDSLFWVGSGGLPHSFNFVASTDINNFLSGDHHMDIGLHRSFCHTRQSTAKLISHCWNPNEEHTTFTQPLSHVVSVKQRSNIQDAIQAFKKQQKAIAVGDCVNSSWGEAWIKLSIEIPSRVYTTGKVPTTGASVQHNTNGDSIYYRNKFNEVQLHFDFQAESSIYVPAAALYRREGIANNVTNKATTTNPRLFDDEFMHAQAIAGMSGGDRRTEYTLHYNMADNYHPTILPDTITFTLYIHTQFNSMFGNSDIGDNIAPPAPLRTFQLKQIDIMHHNSAFYELYWDFYIISDVMRSYKETPFGSQAQRVCMYVMTILLAVQSRKFNVANFFMQNTGKNALTMTPYFADGDCVDINNTDIIINVYNHHYDPLYKQCSAIFSAFIDGINANVGSGVNQQINYIKTVKNDGELVNNHIVANLLSHNKSSTSVLATSNIPYKTSFCNTTTNPFVSAPIVFSFGHCHIDTCWLWAYAHSRSKIVNSWSNQLSLAATYPFHNLVFSSALQMKWLKEDHPQLFTILQQHIGDLSPGDPNSYQNLAKTVKNRDLNHNKKPRKFFPIGGSYLENDLNIPSYEHLARNFVIGQRYFMRYYGEKSSIYFLPDTFGYTTRTPSIAGDCGIEMLITQKLSWNQFNEPINHVMHWKGLDDSTILTHFLPTNTYNAAVTVNEVKFHVDNNKDAAVSNYSTMLYGYGDGGGGPIRAMLECGPRISAFALQNTNLNNVSVHTIPTISDHVIDKNTGTINQHPSTHHHDVQQVVNTITTTASLNPLPLLVYDSPYVFKQLLQKDQHLYNTHAYELYFEMHRGTYTNQAMIKNGNCLNQNLMTTAEYYLTLYYVLVVNLIYNMGGAQQKWAQQHQQATSVQLTSIELNTTLFSVLHAEIDIITHLYILSKQAFEIIFLNAFHDALPGTSINIANHDIIQLHAQCTGILMYIIRTAVKKIAQYHFRGVVMGASGAHINGNGGDHIASHITESTQNARYMMYFNPSTYDREEFIVIPKITLTFKDKFTKDGKKSELNRTNVDNDFLLTTPTNIYTPETTRDQLFYSHYRGMAPWETDQHKNVVPKQYDQQPLCAVLKSLTYCQYHPIHTYTSSMDKCVDWYNFHNQIDEILANSLDYYVPFDHNNYHILQSKSSNVQSTSSQQQSIFVYDVEKYVNIPTQHNLFTNYYKLHQSRMKGIATHSACPSGDDIMRERIKNFAPLYTNPNNQWIDPRGHHGAEDILKNTRNTSSKSQYFHSLNVNGDNLSPGHYVDLDKVPIFMLNTNSHAAVDLIRHRITSSSHATPYELMRITVPAGGYLLVDLEKQPEITQVPPDDQDIFDVIDIDDANTHHIDHNTHVIIHKPINFDIPHDKVYINKETLFLLPQSILQSRSTSTLHAYSHFSQLSHDTTPSTQTSMDIVYSLNDNTIGFSFDDTRYEPVYDYSLCLDVLVIENNTVRYELLKNGRILRAYDKRTATSRPIHESSAVNNHNNIKLYRPTTNIHTTITPSSSLKDGSFIYTLQEFFVSGARSIYQQPHSDTYEQYVYTNTSISSKKSHSSPALNNDKQEHFAFNQHPIYIDTSLYDKIVSKLNNDWTVPNNTIHPLSEYGGNTLYLHVDMDNHYDAWDIALYTNGTFSTLKCHYLESNSIKPSGDNHTISSNVDNLYDVAVIQLYYHMYNEPTFGGVTDTKQIQLNALNSYKLLSPETTTEQKQSFYNHIVQTISLFPNSHLFHMDLLVDNSASIHKMLRTSFPIHLTTPPHLLYETQCGLIERSNNLTNNSHQIAQYEVCAQRFMIISESNGVGANAGQKANPLAVNHSPLTVSIQTIAKHGFSAKNNVVMLTLLRSASRPDNYGDRHIHSISYQIGSYYNNGNHFATINQDATNLHFPLICMPLADLHPTTADPAPTKDLFMKTSNPNVAIVAVKLAENTVLTKLSHFLMNLSQGNSDTQQNTLISDDLSQNNPLFQFMNECYASNRRKGKGLSPLTTPPNSPSFFSYLFGPKTPDFTTTQTPSVFIPQTMDLNFTNNCALPVPNISQLSFPNLSTAIIIRIVETCGISSFGNIILNGSLFNLVKSKAYWCDMLENNTNPLKHTPVTPLLTANGDEWHIPYQIKAFGALTIKIHLNKPPIY